MTLALHTSDCWVDPEHLWLKETQAADAENGLSLKELIQV